MDLLQPVNQASVLAAGQSLVPDYAKQEAERRLLAIQEMSARTQQQKQETAIRRQAEFQRAMDRVLMNPTAEAYSGLMARFPEFSEGIKRGWDSLDKDQQRANLQGMSEVYAAAANGRNDLAASLLERRIAADKEADGTADPTDEAILAGLKSADPIEQKAALGMIGVGLAAITGPEQFATTYGKLTEAQRGKKKVREIDGVVYDDDPDSPTFGKALYASQRTEIVNGLGGIFERDPFQIGGETQQPGQPQAASSAAPTAGEQEPSREAAIPVPNAKALVEQMYPSARVTDWRRDPNSKLGRANKGSWHNHSGAAVDTAPIPGMTFGGYVKSFQDRGLAIIEQRDEVRFPSKHATGPHWHVVIGYYKVNSAQQYGRLPKGAQFIDPDGNLRTKS